MGTMLAAGHNKYAQQRNWSIIMCQNDTLHTAGGLKGIAIAVDGGEGGAEEPDMGKFSVYSIVIIF